MNRRPFFHIFALATAGAFIHTRSFVEHLLSYALGRKLELADQPAVSEIQHAAAADGQRFSRVVTEIVKAYPFGHVRNLKATAP